MRGRGLGRVPQLLRNFKRRLGGGQSNRQASRADLVGRVDYRLGGGLGATGGGRRRPQPLRQRQQQGRPGEHVFRCAPARSASGFACSGNRECPCGEYCGPGGSCRAAACDELGGDCLAYGYNRTIAAFASCLRVVVMTPVPGFRLRSSARRGSACPRRT